jgi:hypothetical protein
MVQARSSQMVQPRSSQMVQARSSQVLLAPGMEVQWATATASEQPGHVRAGQSMVGPDGAIELGPYGSCPVAGLSLDQATRAVEKQLASYMKSPQVRLTTTMPSRPAQPDFRSSRPAAETAHAEPASNNAIVVLSGENPAPPVPAQATGDGIMAPGPGTPTSARPRLFRKSNVVHVNSESGTVYGGTIVEGPAPRPSPLERIRGFFNGGRLVR